MLDGHVTVPGDAATGDPSSPAFAVVPAGATRGVVVVHEILGPAPEIERVVRRFAAAGWAAVAPDLFRQGRISCVRATLHAMRTGADVAPVRQALRARDWLCGVGGFGTERVGVIGFCFGGGFALLAGPRFAVVSANYGVVPETTVMRGTGPVIACYGGRDRSMRAMPARLEARLSALGVEHELHVYPEAGHSFLTDGHRPLLDALGWPLFRIRYDPATAEHAWARILAFFDRHVP